MIVRILAFVALVLAPTGAWADWREARSQHFIVFGDVGEKQLRDLTEKLERFDAVLRMVMTVPEGSDSNPLNVFAVRNQKEVRKLADESLSFASGFYRPGAAGSYAVASLDEGHGAFAPDAEVVLYHEYAHHFMLQYFPIAFPGWYVEGFAEYASTIDFDRKDRPMVGRPAVHRLPGLAASRQMPAEKLLTSSVGDLEQDALGAYYARSWLLTHYLRTSDQRRGQLAAYIRAINEGQSLAEAAAIFGDLRVLDKELDDYFRKGAYPYFTLDVATPPTGSIVMREMRPAEVALAPERLAYLAGLPADMAPAFLARVEAVAASHPNDPLVLQLLAAGRLATEDFAGAEAAADAWLAIEPNASRALLAKGVSRLRQVAMMDDPGEDDWKAARAWIVKANRADSNDPLPLIEYHRSFGAARQPAPEVALDGLQRALELAPQDQGLRISFAIQLAVLGHFESAGYVIRPLAFSPHDSGAAQQARKFLAAFEKEELPGYGKLPGRPTAEAVEQD